MTEPPTPPDDDFAATGTGHKEALLINGRQPAMTARLLIASISADDSIEKREQRRAPLRRVQRQACLPDACSAGWPAHIAFICLSSSTLLISSKKGARSICNIKLLIEGSAAYTTAAHTYGIYAPQQAIACVVLFICRAPISGREAILS